MMRQPISNLIHRRLFISGGSFMWLCIRFPLLPLESLLRSLPTKQSMLSEVMTEHRSSDAFNHSSSDTLKYPIAVSENNKIICCNQAAYQQGIREQQSLSTSYTLVDELKLIERRVAQEQQMLQNLAITLSTFSPTLHLCPPQCVQLEIGRSLKLFNGLNQLIQSIEDTLNPLAITFQWAIALTPKMAEVFSLNQQQVSHTCWQPDSQTISRSQCLALLRKLPINQLFLAPEIKERITSLGIKYTGELLTLPLASLRKRLGSEATQYIQQLIGKLSDNPKDFQLPTEFIRDLEFIDVIHSREALLFPIQRLLNELCYFLRLQQKHTQLLHWILRDSYHVSTEFTVQLAEPDSDPKVSFEITRLKLDHITLTGPIEALSLKVTHFSDINAQSGSLFLQSEDFNDSLKFVSKIRAHLGDGSCYWLQQEPEVIPELAQKTYSQNQITSDILNSSTKALIKGKKPEMVVMESNPRPAWLFETPQKIGHLKEQLFWNGRLSIISQEERITGYWWKKPVHRDYFIAQHTSGSFYWIFFDHQKEQWFVHGIYS